jgi:hypothetical protein
MLVIGLGWNGFGLNTAYRAYNQVLEYWTGTAVLTPSIEMRTKAEIEAEMKRSKKTTATILVLRACSNRGLYRLVVYSVMVVMLIGSSLLVLNYERTQFRPNCINASHGTPFATQTVLPLVANNGLVSAATEISKLGNSLQVHANNECQQVWQASLSRYNNHLQEYEYVRVSTLLAVKRIDIARDALDNLSLICGISNQTACSEAETNELSNKTLTSSVIDCSDLDIPPIGNIENIDSLPIDDVAISKKVCVVQWWAVSSFWVVMGTAFSMMILTLVGRNGIIEGLHILWRKYLRPEEFHVHNTCHRPGTYTQPEYGEVEARKEAIGEYLVWLRLKGWMFFLGGVGTFLAFTTFGIYLSLSVRYIPVWWPGP